MELQCYCWYIQESQSLSSVPWTAGMYMYIRQGYTVLGAEIHVLMHI